MLLTVVLLAAIIWVVPYLTFQPRTEALPASIPFSQQAWMRFIPDTAEFISYVDYRLAYDATGNYSLFGTGPAVEVYSPAFTISPHSVEYELSIALAGKDPKETVPTVTVVKIEPTELSHLEEALRNSTILHKTTHGNHIIFSPLVRHRELKTQLVTANLAVAYEHLLMTEGTGSMNSLTQVLDTADYRLDEFFSQQAARTALYASGGADSNYVALFIATFPTQIEGAKIAMKTVKTASETVTSQIAFSFNSEDEARNQYNNVKKLYSGGKDYWILGPFVVVSFGYDMTKLSEQMRGL
jgi:hypothetical protein